MPIITIENIHIEVTQKNIKNIHLKICPPRGDVKISAPKRMPLEAIHTFALSKLDWIEKQRRKFQNFKVIEAKKFVDNETHYFQGEPYFLRVIEADAKPKVHLEDGEMILYIRPNTPTEKRKTIIDNWYRQEIKKEIIQIVDKWEKIIGVKINEFGVKLMRTKWGTCNITAKRIWLNLELIKKPLKCLEYVIVHELVHLLERYHNARFYGFMDKFMPDWKIYDSELNKSSLEYID